MKTLRHLFALGMVIGLILSAAQPTRAIPHSPVSSGGERDWPVHVPAPVPATGTNGPEEPPPDNKIEPLLLRQLRTEAQADFFIWLTERADLSPAYRLKTKEEKGRFVFETLRATAERTQKNLRAYLNAQGVTYQPFYISNRILVRGGDQRLLFNLAARSDVARLTANHRYQLDKPRINPKGVQGVLVVGTNIAFVNTDDVWALGFTGQGVVLAGNDTGLAWQHPAIKNHYRGWNGVTADHNYNWWDATDTYPSAPADGFGHGTHTTGTMVGDDGGTNQIGMAPGAQTVHCKNMDDWGGGWDSTFIECFQWDLAPWDLTGQNPRPDLAPDAVNNSWGYWGGGYPTFEDEIAALQAAGILVEVSAGNEGPGCGTLRSPGDYGDVLTTGSVSHAGGTLPGSLTWFSSRGPSTLSPEYIPDVMAPGENVRSAVPGGGYQSWDGTSMAGPHVVGLIGLMWAANPALRGLVPETQLIIFATTVPLAGQGGSNCGGDYVIGPNHDWGYGTIDALAAVQTAMDFGGVGTLTGTVTDSASEDPLARVLIRASLTPDLTWQTRTDEFGQYSRAVFSGTYTVTAQLYGYYPATHTGVEVISGTTTILDIQMDPAPFYLVSGQVTDVTTGWPLYVRIDIEGYPGGPVWTDPVSGQYSVSLAAGVDYTFRVNAWVDGYQTALRAVGPLGGPQTEDFALDTNLVACVAPGYEPEFVYFEDFEADDGGYTVEGYSSWEWGVPTSGPRRAHSGSHVWATNLSGTYFENEDGYLVSPDMDLSAYAGQAVIVSWWQWLQTEDYGYDWASVEVTNDGGTSWTMVYGPVYGPVDTTWTKHALALDPIYAVSNFRVRFHLYSDYSINFPGFYVDGVGVGALPPTLYAEDFEADDGGYTVSGTTSWEWGTPTRGPSGAHSGVNAWATNLSGNYENNEDGYLTSPAIDLSPGAGSSLLLSWWQWLQTESGYDFASVEVNDGTSWTEVYTTSGIITTDWAEVSVLLDPGYGVSNFQVRFRLQSDGSLTYPGFYADDVRVEIYTGVPPALPCKVPSGGLVVGNVYDANTGDGLNDAAVASSERAATTQATPYDEALNEGFYTMFAAAGPQVLTATMTDGYGAEIQTPTVVLSSTIRQDFNLPAGLLAFAPSSLQVTLDMGISTTRPFTLSNVGGSAAAFELRERDTGFVPTTRAQGRGEWLYRSTDGVSLPTNKSRPHSTALAYPSAYRWQPASPSGGALNILVYADDPYHPAPNTYVDQALQYLGLPYTAHYDGDFAGFEADLTSDTWDIVIFADDNWLPYDFAGLLSALNDYVAGGGRLILHSWGVGFEPNDPLWTTLGFTWAGDNNEPPAPVYSWDPAHPVFTDPLDVPEFTLLSGYRYGVYGQFVEPLPDFEATAGYTTPGPDPNQAALILGNDGDTVFRAFMDGQNDADLDADGLMDGAELWVNLISGIQFGFATNVPWLATDVVTGTPAAAGQQVINVTFDAGVPEITQPGQYAAELRVLDDTPYNIGGLPVAMRVNLPAGWGKLAGTITGLERCDAPGTPLSTATVEILGLATTQSSASGMYGYWMLQGTYTVTVSATGYVSQTFTVTIVAGQITSRDVDLRLDAPCTSPPAAALNVTVYQGGVATQTLTLDNAGGGGLSFTFFESLLDLAPIISPTQASAPGDAFRLFAQTGPASVLALEPQASEPDSVALPLSRWFGGLDLPNGLVRYAHAQCAEQAESFYVFGGVDEFGLLSKGAWRYDAAINTWTRLADMPAGGEAPSAACYQGKIYVMGGSGSDQFYIYDVVSNKWTSGAPLPRGVEGAAAAAWAGKVYLVGGDDDFAPSTDISDQVDIYDIATDTWIGTGTPLPVATSNAGFVQTGPYLYVVGGWNELSPDANVNATQRYGLEADVWELGPDFASARADLALAATEGALYAIGGDQNGGQFFEPTKTVERLDLTGWPGETWADTNDPLPVAFTANNAGFCTQALFNGDVAEVWSVGGLDRFGWISSRTLFREAAGEACYSIYTDVPWLSEAPAFGTVPGDSTSPVTLTFDATALALENYTATLIVQTNDAGNYLTHIPVTMGVVPAPVVPTRLYYLPLVLNNSGGVIWTRIYLSMAFRNSGP